MRWQNRARRGGNAQPIAKGRPQRPAWPTIRRALALQTRQSSLLFMLVLTTVISALTALVPALGIRAIIDGPLRRGNADRLDFWVFWMIVFVIVGAAAAVAQTYLGNLIGQRIMFDLRQRLYVRLSSMSMRWFTANRTGETLSRVTNDVTAIQPTVSQLLTNVISNFVTACATFSLMLVIDWKFSLFCIAFMPIFILPTRLIGQVQRRLNQRQFEHTAELNAHMQETLSVSGALLVKTFGRTDFETRRFSQTAGQIRDVGVLQAMTGRWFTFGMGLFGSASPALVYWFGGHRNLEGDVTVGTVVAFSVLLQRVFFPATALLNAHIVLLGSIALFERIFDYLDLKPEISDKPNAVALPRARGEVNFDHVSFAYDAGQPVLTDVTFAAPAGRFVAIVGHSGAGKTTAAQLIARLYDVDSGAVRIDGHDVRDLTLESVADSIGFVNQETFLFHDTIAANIQYGRPEATEVEVEAAAAAANIHEMIAALPEGYRTIAGERGFRLSGGEKQRIAIARAILKDPAILILDEATSSLDSRTERAIQSAIEQLARNRTVIAIAHRLSTVRRADEILVMDKGRIVERGRHEELLLQGGLYADLYRQQFSHDEE